MKKKYILNTIFALLILNQLNAQDAHFSQYNEMTSNINPALAGAIYDTRVTGGYRTQWGGIGKAYKTFGVAFEQAIKVKKLKGNHFVISGNIYKDVSGDAKLGTLNPNLGVSYIQKISKTTKFSAGLQGGFVYKTIDVSALRWDRQFNGYAYDASLPSYEETPRSAITAYDLGGGFNFSYAQSEKFISAKDGNKFNAGASVYHFSIPKNSFFTSSEKLATRYCVYASADINIPNSKNAIMPSFIYMGQGPSNEFLVGALFKFILADQSIHTSIKKPSAFSVGVQYRYKDAIIPVALWQYDKYAIGLSYDVNVSALTPASKRYGGIEVVLRYNTSPGYGKKLGRVDTRASY
jgi:type IX secretion system PorP/SprF family membrane protein